MSSELLRRRRRALADTYELFYDDPVELVRGEGIHLYDSSGRRYLDCYNNVASVGHAHPRVVEALTNQAWLLNTHTRYLHRSVVELAERLAGKLGRGLSSSVFVCTGSEANDLAVRMARLFTGSEGIVVNDHSYHGGTGLTQALSVSSLRNDPEPPRWVGAAEPPNTYRGPYPGADDQGAAYADSVRRAADGLIDNGSGLAAFLVDSSWDADGFLNAPPDYLALAAEQVRGRGGLVIADEVQAGYCRTGDTWWGYEDYGIFPDIVTLGKPMGAGHPIGAVVTKPEIAARFAEKSGYFNTFGGNPVSSEVALAVIDVIDDENLLDNVDRTGDVLGQGLRELSGRHDLVGAVDGKGLYWGVDLVVDREAKKPLSQADTRRLVTQLRHRGVLMGVCGRYLNTVKIRPPLVFNEQHAGSALEILDETLDEFEPRDR
jgi:4-aminobutyrate aminotransferase-like enzyme